MIDLTDWKYAEEIYWFVVNNYWETYQKQKEESPLSMAEFVQENCLLEFESALKEKGYKL